MFRFQVSIFAELASIGKTRPRDLKPYRHVYYITTIKLIVTKMLISVSASVGQSTISESQAEIEPKPFAFLQVYNYLILRVLYGFFLVHLLVYVASTVPRPLVVNFRVFSAYSGTILLPIILKSSKIAKTNHLKDNLIF